VQAIVSGDLENAWRSFYQPSAMILTLAGDFDAEPLLCLIGSKLERASRGPIAPARLAWPPEPPLPSGASARLTLDVGAPSFLVGFKDPWFSQSAKISGRELAARQIAGRLLLGTLLSPSAPLYDGLFSEHLINDSFGYQYVCEESYAYVVCGGESPDPERAAAAVRDRLVSSFRKGHDAALFEIQKRVAAGDYVRSLDSVEHSGLAEAQSCQYGLDLFDYPAFYDKMDVATASRVLDFLANPSSCSIATIHQEVKVST
jgi:predicted Zn-dependent peptidase